MALRGEGFYALYYAGPSGDSGFALLAFDTLKVYGIDAGGVRYTGDYHMDQNAIVATLTLTIPPGVASVLPGVSTSQQEQSISLAATMPRQGGPVIANTSHGQVAVQLIKIADFPN